MSTPFILFPDTDTEKQKSWAILSDVHPDKRKEWNDRIDQLNREESTRVVVFRLTEEALKERQQTNARLIQELKRELSSGGLLLSKRHLYVLLDKEGFLLQMFGSSPIVNKLDRHQAPGINMSLESAGLTCYTLTREVGRTAVMLGPENTSQIFRGFTSIGTPVTVDGEILGWLGLAIQKQHDIELSVALLQTICANLEIRLAEPSSQTFTEEQILEHLDLYGLTAREKEVALRWISLAAASEIASELYITEGTVRNMIKQIYRKTGINDKGKFITRFLFGDDFGR